MLLDGTTYGLMVIAAVASSVELYLYTRYHKCIAAVVSVMGCFTKHVQVVHVCLC